MCTDDKKEIDFMILSAFNSLFATAPFSERISFTFACYFIPQYAPPLQVNEQGESGYNELDYREARGRGREQGHKYDQEFKMLFNDAYNLKHNYESKCGMSKQDVTIIYCAANFVYMTYQVMRSSK